jgi:MFS family permease
MLLSALGTSIANVGLPTLVQAFDASFQAVQWVVLAYLLAVTTLVVMPGGWAMPSAGAGCCWPAGSVHRGLGPVRPGAHPRLADCGRALQGLGPPS